MHTNIDLISAASIPSKPVNWLWNGWIAAGMTAILAGAPGTGKTTIAMCIAAIFSRGGLGGRRWPDNSYAPTGNVIIMGCEDGIEETIVPRLIAADADRTKIAILRGTLENGRYRAFDYEKDIARLEDEIARIGNVSLIVIDSFVRVVAGDSHKNSEVQRAMDPLVALGKKHSCAILGIMHLNKSSKGKEPLDRLNGSLAFGSIARTVLFTARATSGSPNVDQPSCVLVRAKSNIGPDGGGFGYRIVGARLKLTTCAR